MKDKKPLDWIPLFIDKHIFGSTRLELEPDERSVWIDLMVLSGKDSGYIRANEGVPYPSKQLAGLLVISEELLERTIDKCKSKKIKKIEEMKDGTLYLPTYEEYKLSARHKRRFEAMSGKSDIMSGKADAKSKSNSKGKKSKEELEREKAEKLLKKEFDEFWNLYAHKISMDDAFNAFKALRRKGIAFEIILKAASGYKQFIKARKIHDNFDQEMKYPAGFLRKNFWKDYLEFKYKPPM